MREEEIKKAVRDSYAEIATKKRSAPATSCCGSEDVVEDISRRAGYSDKDLETVPEGANLGLGCGNPVAMTSLKEGETVLDLGSGAGFDCFLAANRVGKRGKVIGVDMTPEMIQKARENARKGNYENVEFRLGEIENIPAGDNSVDAVISNCVINLAPDKKRVFKEAFRALKPGGRLVVSDIVLLKELPEVIRNDIRSYIGCISGAVTRDDYLAAIKSAGFKEVKTLGEVHFPAELMANDPTAKALREDLKVPPEALNEVANSIVSLKVHAIKPNAG
jgi:SAM-dependent methyltransferase